MWSVLWFCLSITQALVHWKSIITVNAKNLHAPRRRIFRLFHVLCHFLCSVRQSDTLFLSFLNNSPVYFSFYSLEQFRWFRCSPGVRFGVVAFYFFELDSHTSCGFHNVLVIFSLLDSFFFTEVLHISQVWGSHLFDLLLQFSPQIFSEIQLSDLWSSLHSCTITWLCFSRAVMRNAEGFSFNCLLPEWCRICVLMRWL